MSKARQAYILAIIAWAMLIVALMLTTGKPESDHAPAEQEPQIHTTATEETFNLIMEPEIDRVEPKDDAIDLAKFNQIENATTTGYCICKKCCGKDPDHPAYGITASGRPAEPFVSVAVDPFMIELGSTVYLDYGDGELHEFRADDTGSGVNGAHIDVCYPDHQSALEHGVQIAKAYWKEE